MITLYLNLDSIGTLTDSTGAQKADKLAFHLESYQTYSVNFGTIANGTFTNQDVSDGLSWTAALDVDFNHSTDPLVVVDHTDCDPASAADGIVKINVDCDTEEFLAAVAAKESIEGYFQIRGYDNVDPDQGKVIYSYIVPCLCYNAITVHA